MVLWFVHSCLLVYIQFVSVRADSSHLKHFSYIRFEKIQTMVEIIIYSFCFAFQFTNQLLNNVIKSRLSNVAFVCPNGPIKCIKLCKRFFSKFGIVLLKGSQPQGIICNLTMNDFIWKKYFPIHDSITYHLRRR